MSELRDLLGREVKVGDRVVYGKSSRHRPMALGVVEEITDERIKVLGDGMVRAGTIPIFNARERLVVINDIE